MASFISSCLYSIDREFAWKTFTASRHVFKNSKLLLYEIIACNLSSPFMIVNVWLWRIYLWHTSTRSFIVNMVTSEWVTDNITVAGCVFGSHSKGYGTMNGRKNTCVYNFIASCWYWMISGSKKGRKTMNNDHYHIVSRIYVFKISQHVWRF